MLLKIRARRCLEPPAARASGARARDSAGAAAVFYNIFYAYTRDRVDNARAYSRLPMLAPDMIDGAAIRTAAEAAAV